MSGEQGLCSGVSVLCISAPWECGCCRVPAAQLVDNRFWCTSGFSALLLLPPEGANSVPGLAQTADTKEASPVLWGVWRLRPSTGWMDQGRVVSWSLPAQPRGGLNDDFGEPLKFRPSSELPKAWIWRCVCYPKLTFSWQFSGSCRNWLPSLEELLCFLEKSLPAGSPAEPPHQAGCTLTVLTASMPLLVWLSLWPPTVFPFTLIFFFIPPGSTTLPPRLLLPLDHSTCMGSSGHLVSVEAGGLRKALGWGKEGRKEE